MKSVILRLIRFYQVAISPLSPPTCRFVPSCSQYGYQTIEKYGLVRGLWLAAKRLARCHPFHPGGFDPAP
ncbi:MAG: membrane protein insertion efficiency factor YidD [Chloroflexi bacterium]|nr:membrane protein insertion efficiency factor YidD [Chloroflexota bacterium]